MFIASCRWNHTNDNGENVFVHFFSRLFSSYLALASAPTLAFPLFAFIAPLWSITSGCWFLPSIFSNFVRNDAIHLSKRSQVEIFVHTPLYGFQMNRSMDDRRNRRNGWCRRKMDKVKRALRCRSDRTG